MRKSSRGFLVILLSIILLLTPFNTIAMAEELPFRVDSVSAILMDYDTGTILYSHNPDEKLPIASLNKIMTILLALEAIDEGKLSLDDEVTVSDYASSMGGSQVFLEAGETLSVDSLLKAIIVASGNDASVAIAEKIAGTHEVFVNMMNERAKELGMSNTNFVNATGLPAPGGYSTAKDVAIMSRELLRHNLFFKWSTIWVDNLEESKNNTSLANTNRLVRFYEGADGIKTGSTSEAKYCLSATAKRGNMRLVSVVLAAPTTKVRFGESSKLLDYGFANFELVPIVKKDQIIQEDIYVSKGKTESVNGIVANDISKLIKKGESKEFEKVINLNEEIKAPLKAGEKIGTLSISLDGQVLDTVDIVTDRDVGRANVLDYFKKLFRKWTRKDG